MLPTLLPYHLYYVSEALDPALEIWDADDTWQRVALRRVGSGRRAGEGLWLADLSRCLPAAADTWQFRIDRGDGGCEHPEFAPYFTTRLRSLWLQDGQIFDCQPAPHVSSSQVIKIEGFTGSLPARALYVYLPRGYAEHVDRQYPVLYMHDGQNCFDAFVEDSYAGSWQADLAADVLIRQGLLRECIIAGVSNGAEQRIMEYLPLYARHLPPPRRPTQAAPPSAAPPLRRRPLMPVPGRAEETYRYYRDEVAPAIQRRWRVMPGRENTATCGSSLGGLFTIFIAWEHPEFARHHAALSTSFWVTRNKAGLLEAVERMRTHPRHDIRLWLDSGTLSAPGRGDDGLNDTLRARDALLAAGYAEGRDLQYHCAEGATHSEAAWAARLPLILQFLFPAGEV